MRSAAGLAVRVAVVPKLSLNLLQLGRKLLECDLSFAVHRGEDGLLRGDISGLVVIHLGLQSGVLLREVLDLFGECTGSRVVEGAQLRAELLRKSVQSASLKKGLHSRRVGHRRAELRA